MTKRDEFIRDIRRVLEAAFQRMTANESKASQPLHDAQVQMLWLAITGMNERSYETSSLHYAYRMALVILGYERDFLRASDERMARYKETGDWE
jgi:hypothetical protein